MLSLFHTTTSRPPGLGKGTTPSPPLKWAGGKTQLLDELLALTPASYGTYFEPFLGGGALFFALQPRHAVLSDSNPDLINFYIQLRDRVERLIEAAGSWPTDEKTFYEVRAISVDSLNDIERAARMLYLNRTCFNGLYRVNRRGEFNVPYGRYKSPRIVDGDNLRAASQALQSAEILCADYATVVEPRQKAGDLLFFDPPYMPVGKYADFKRYTKEQFHEADQVRLASLINSLCANGCHVIATNSNHTTIRRLYDGLETRVIKTKRNINSNGLGRFGEDVIIRGRPIAPIGLRPQVAKYPATRFMGSKEKLLPEIWDAIRGLQGNTVLDLFSGTGVVSYMLKAQGKRVISNDYMSFPAVFAKALVENSSVRLSADDVKLLTTGAATDRFVRENFKGLYFSDADNLFIDLVRSHIPQLNDSYKIALAKAALIRACMKKRARGIFTYVGPRYDDGRADMHYSLREHFKKAVEILNEAIFDNGQQSVVLNANALEVSVAADIVYIDPPYFSPLSDNDYVRRYHFVEGIARDWQGVELQAHTKTKKFKTYGSAFSTRDGATAALETIFQRYAGAALVVSYSSNSLPGKNEMIRLLRSVKKDVMVVPVDHTYSFGNHAHKAGNANNRVSEYLFVAT